MKHIEFTENQIRLAFEPATFTRGKTQLYLAGKVGPIKLKQVSEHGGKVSAIVKGSGRQSYLTQVEILRRDNRLRIHSTCDCPVGSYCKHAVAVCLELLNSPLYYSFREKLGFVDQLTIKTQQTAKTDPKFDEWMKRLKRNIYGISGYGETIERWFRFRLFKHNTELHSNAKANDFAKPDIEIIRHQYTPTGRLSKPKAISIREAQSLDYDYSLNELSLQALQLLSSCQHEKGYYQTNPKLLATGNAGFLVLKQLIQMEIADFKENHAALSWSDNDHLLEWQYEETSKIPEMGKLTANLKPTDFLVLCEPPILIDTETLTACCVQTNLPAITLEGLLTMPEIYKAQFAELIDFLDIETQRLLGYQKQVPTLPLPQIPGLAIQSIREKPTGILKMVEGAPYPIFQSSFRYGKIALIPLNNKSVIRERIDGVKYEIHRDLDAEKRLFDTLQPYFLPAGQDYANQWLLYDSLDTQSGMQNWLQVQEALPKLEQQGWKFHDFESLLYQIDSIENIQVSTDTQEDWFELQFTFQVQGQTFSLASLLSPLLQDYDHSEDLPEEIIVHSDEQRLLKVQRTEIAPLFDTLIELWDKESGGTYRIEPFESHLIAGLENLDMTWKGGQELRTLAQKLKHFNGITEVTPPAALGAQLRDYQQFGLNWLNFLHEYQFHGILADDMGLGKTLQTLSFIQHLKSSQQLNQPVLLILPTSLIANWKAEAARFTPEIKVLAIQGSERHSLFEQISEHDLVISTYPLIVRDHAQLNKHNFYYLILDEAQKIKNPKTKLYKALQDLNSQHRLCLTGTPVENNLTELWSLFNFLMPGFLGNLPQFKRQYQKPIENDREQYAQTQLNQRIQPFLLRRTKHQVAKELPDKTEIFRVVEFDSAQANLYETIRISMEEKVKQAVSQKGLAKSHITLLDALLKLRQVCCDPSLIKMESAKKIKHSAKLELLMELLEDLLEGGHRILVFSQFTSMLRIIEKRLQKSKIEYSLLTGQTKHRETQINQFTAGDTSVFLISLKAGGVGLNLTQADTVIHYDPWWNPAVENQATDRAYRIGQDKEVFVYKLVAANTIEEKILELQAKKQTLQDQLYASGESQQTQANLDGKDLLALLKNES